MKRRIAKIISGGQTGVDRGGLQAAIALGIPHGGFCPRGRKSEDGSIPEAYSMTETKSAAYPPRTALNIATADATLVLVRGLEMLKDSRGTKLTLKLCRSQGKPWLLADVRAVEQIDKILDWIERIPLDDHEVILNIAGPRESKAPRIEEQTASFLGILLSRINGEREQT